MEKNFRTLIEHLPTAVLIHRDARIIYANQAMLTLLAYERREDLLGRSPFDITPPEQHATIRARIAQVAVDIHTPPIEQRLVRRDGGVVTVEIEGLQLEFDERPAIVVLARDLTERRQMMARLAVADRMLSVGTLAAGVAHEINNPLAYVINNLNVLSDELPLFLGRPAGATPRLTPDQVAGLLRDAREGAARVQAVVRDLRTLSRGDDDKLGPVDLRKVLESSVKLAKNEVRHRARLVEQYGDVPPVMANESRVGQVFLNLLINAAQAIEDGHAAHHVIRVVTRADEPDHVIIEVHDTGRGIPAENLGRIFDPFFTTKPLGEGTGLGLSICHGIVKSLNGTISVESEVGTGSVFRVRLPAAKGAALQVPAKAKPVAVRRGRILVVDDEPSMGTSLRILLSPEHDVIAVTRARQALALIEAGERFDAILCDLMMPEMGGMGLHEALAQSAPALAERMVFFTGGAFTERAADFLGRCKNPTLEKPFDETELRAALQSVMDRERND